jgi:pyruvate dehydrogenase E1 component alpha subunit
MKLPRDTALALLRQMIRIRRFEEKCAEAYSAGKIRGFLHLYIGEEAVAAGVMPALAEEDAVLATYREHGHALARGIPAQSVMAEMYGKQEGCSRGRGGSMHLFDAGRRFYGGNAIVAGALPVAVGMALADKMQKRNRVTACFFGEGAMAEGEFHESMNLAELWKLPVLFLCENNLYAMGTALWRSESDTDLITKAASYNMATARVDGMDVEAVWDAAHEAAATIRRLGVPYFLELQTYRFRAHSMFDPELYRDKSEVEKWKQHCPIQGFIGKLEQAGYLSPGLVEGLEADVQQEVARAVAFAEAGTLEPVEDLEKDVYTPSAATAAAKPGVQQGERLW